MALIDAITAIQTKVAALEGIKSAPSSPPESNAAFPFAICYPGTGDIELASAGWGKGLHTIILEIHVARQVLPLDFIQSVPYADRIIAMFLADPQIAGSVTSTNRIRYNFLAMRYAAIDTLGYRFEIGVKQNASI